MSEPSEDEELNYLRTKLLLLGIAIDRLPTDSEQLWYIANTDRLPRTFCFKPPYNIFYKTALEAAEHGIMLVIAGAYRFGPGGS